MGKATEEESAMPAIRAMVLAWPSEKGWRAVQITVPAIPIASILASPKRRESVPVMKNWENEETMPVIMKHRPTFLGCQPKRC